MTLLILNDCCFQARAATARIKRAQCMPASAARYCAHSLLEA